MSLKTSKRILLSKGKCHEIVFCVTLLTSGPMHQN